MISYALYCLISLLNEVILFKASSKSFLILSGFIAKNGVSFFASILEYIIFKLFQTFLKSSTSWVILSNLFGFSLSNFNNLAAVQFFIKASFIELIFSLVFSKTFKAAAGLSAVSGLF